MLGSGLTYTDEDGDTVVIIYAHVLGLRIERALKPDYVSLQFLLGTGLEELKVPDAIARKMLDDMGLKSVLLPKNDE